MRIVHAANYQLKKNAALYYALDVKIHQGLVQNGHYVYPFPVNDIARMRSTFNNKWAGRHAANKSLIETCTNMMPQMLLLGHAQLITRQTIETIREKCPGIRVGYWYCDPLWDGHPTGHLHDRLGAFDAVFVTTGGPLCQELARPNQPAGYLPNLVEPEIERMRVFEHDEFDHDLVFMGRDEKSPERRAFLETLRDALDPAVRFGVFGSLGQPLILGKAREDMLARSKMALNLSRRNDVPLYTSDRVVHLVANGILTFSPRGGGLEELFAEDEMVYFDDAKDLARRVSELAADDEQRIAIARKGCERAHRDYSAKAVAPYLVNMTMHGADAVQDVPWADHIFTA